MTNADLLSVLKEKVREELCEVADKNIENLVDKFRSELVKNRNTMIAGLLNGIDILSHTDDVTNETTFQINIKSERREKDAGIHRA